MKRNLVLVLALTIVVSGWPALAEEEQAKTLEKLNAKIKKTPDDPMLYYRKAQCLMKLGRRNEGYETAQQAVPLFVKKENTLAWIMLESIDLKHIRVDVHFNMGPHERTPPDTGIMRPLSFRIWKKGKDKAQFGELLEVIDFEIGMWEGKPSSAALGKMEGQRHQNFGTMDTDAKYEVIRMAALKLINKRHRTPEHKKKEKQERG